MRTACAIGKSLVDASDLEADVLLLNSLFLKLAVCKP